MTYVLHIILGKGLWAGVGRLGKLYFKKGAYFYVGSARAGLKARIRRHLSKKKNIFWHIDYLLSSEYAKIKDIWVNRMPRECRTAESLKGYGYGFAAGFGSSDCGCASHLFFIGKDIGAGRNILKAGKFKNADKSSF